LIDRLLNHLATFPIADCIVHTKIRELSELLLEGLARVMRHRDHD
jgi:hypothetical protein